MTQDTTSLHTEVALNNPLGGGITSVKKEVEEVDEQIVDLSDKLLETYLAGSSSLINFSSFKNSTTTTTTTTTTTSIDTEDKNTLINEYFEFYSKVLKLHYRLHYNIFRVKSGESLVKDRFKVILNEALKLHASGGENEQSEENKEQFQEFLTLILSNIVGVSSYYLIEQETDLVNSSYYDQAVQNLNKIQLSSLETDVENITTKYKIMLRLEAYYHLMSLKSPKIYEYSLSDILVCGVPKRTEGLTLYYLDLIVDGMDEHTGTDIINERDNVNSNLLKLYFKIRKHDIQDDKLLQVGQNILKNCFFPQADDKNNKDLEHFHYILTFYDGFKLENYEEWENFFQKSISSTFQSITITHAAIIFYGKQYSNKDKSLIKSVATTIESKLKTKNKLFFLHFENLIIYSKKYQELNDNKYLDIVSLIKLYEKVLSINFAIFGSNTGALNQLKQTQPHLSSALNDASAKYITQFQELLEIFYEKFELNLISIQQCKNMAVNQNIDTLYLPVELSKILTRSWESMYKVQENNLFNLHSNLSLFYLANSIHLKNYENTQRKIDLYYEYAFCLAQQKEVLTSSSFLKNQILAHWPENNIKSWLLLCLLESCNENKSNSFKISCSVLESINENIQQLKFDEKWYVVQMKLTQLSLIQEMFGIKDALEMLPELFELYNTLFTNDEFVYNSSNIRKSKEYLLQSIWIFVSNLYYRDSESMKDAQDCLKECENVENVNYTNLNIFVAKGYLYNDIDLFQKVLIHDPLNVDALVGVAKLIFDQLPAQFVSSQISGVTDDNDRTATLTLAQNNQLADLKLKLEICVENSIEGYFCPEIWFYLSKIYELFSDPSRLETALLNCIKFEEDEPIREFKYCKF